MLTDVLEFYIIEIPKAREILKKDPNNKLAQWVMFLDNPNESEVSKIMNENEEIKEAMSELEKISKDKELKRVAELREKAIRDEKSGLRYAREDGLKEGLEKRTRTTEKKNGMKETEIKIAKKLKQENMSIEKISKITGLTKEEVEKL